MMEYGVMTSGEGHRGAERVNGVGEGAQASSCVARSSDGGTQRACKYSVPSRSERQAGAVSR